MSWSITIEDLDKIRELPFAQLARIGSDNPAYSDDARLLLTAAIACGLVSATLSGGRTPSPYGGPDTVVMSIVGFDSHREGHAVRVPFYPTMIDTIQSQAEAIDFGKLFMTTNDETVTLPEPEEFEDTTDD